MSHCGRFLKCIIKNHDIFMTCFIAERQSAENYTTTVLRRKLLTPIWWQNGKNLVMKIYAVWDAFKHETQTLARIVFVAFQNPNWKKAALLNVCIVVVVDAPDKFQRRYKNYFNQFCFFFFWFEMLNE